MLPDNPVGWIHSYRVLPVNPARKPSETLSNQWRHRTSRSPGQRVEQHSVGVTDQSLGGLLQFLAQLAAGQQTDGLIVAAPHSQLATFPRPSRRSITRDWTDVGRTFIRRAF